MTQPPYIYFETFRFERKLFQNCESLAGIDRGGSLTKIVYVSKESFAKHDDKEIELCCASFLNTTDFTEALLFLKENSCLKEGDALHTTGLGGLLLKELIESTLKVKVVFIEEFFSLASGFLFMLKHGNNENLFFNDNIPERHMEVVGFMNLIAQRFTESVKSDTTKEFEFPVVMGILGSAGGFFKFYEDGRTEILGSQFFCGKSFLGLGKVLLNTKDYNEICELAEQGNGMTTDLFVTDLVPADSPYVSTEDGKLDTVFTFGKVVDHEDGFKKEDIARSLIKLVSWSIANLLSEVCWTSKSKHVVICGNLARSLIFREQLSEDLRWTDMQGYINLKFLKTGHPGAIGTMLGSPESFAEFVQKMVTPAKK